MDPLMPSRMLLLLWLPLCWRKTIYFYVIGWGLWTTPTIKWAQHRPMLLWVFGYCAEVALIMWNLLINHFLLPHEAQIAHLFWALFFVKIYTSKRKWPAVQLVVDKVGQSKSTPWFYANIHLADDQSTGWSGAVLMVCIFVILSSRFHDSP